MCLGRHSEMISYLNIPKKIAIYRYPMVTVRLYIRKVIIIKLSSKQVQLFAFIEMTFFL